MKTHPLISIIVLNWNGKRFIDGFFNSIYQQTYPADRLEILFVDNNSSDDSVEYFNAHNFPRARLIQTGDNYGYAGGNNYGLAQAKGEYIAVCNNDLELDQNWLEELVIAAQRHHADVTVPKLVFAESRTINNAGSILVPHLDWPNLERGIDKPIDDPEFNKECEITAFCGASPLFSRAFLKDVGFFDRRFFLYWEDVDLSWRGQKQHKKYIYAPRSVAYHHTSGSTGGETSPVFIHYVSRNRILILIKHAQFSLVLRGFAKVIRDHILYKVWDCVKSIRNHNGRRSALKALWGGIKIICDALWLTPLMLMKRWGIAKEEHL